MAKKRKNDDPNGLIEEIYNIKIDVLERLNKFEIRIGKLESKMNLLIGLIMFILSVLFSILLKSLL